MPHQLDDAVDVIGIDMGHYQEFEGPLLERQALDLAPNGRECADRSAVDEHPRDRALFPVLDPDAVAVQRRQQLDPEDFAHGCTFYSLSATPRFPSSAMMAKLRALSSSG